MTLGKRLRAARKRVGMSQEQLARELHVSRQAVTKWESDAGIPDIENLRAIARIFGVSIDSMLGDSGEVVGAVVSEPIDTSVYPGRMPLTRFAAAVRARYPMATIYSVVRYRRLSWYSFIIDFLASPGILYVVQIPELLRRGWYVVEQEDRLRLVSVSKNLMESRELAGPIEWKKWRGDSFAFDDASMGSDSFDLGEHRFIRH